MRCLDGPIVFYNFTIITPAVGYGSYLPVREGKLFDNIFAESRPFFNVLVTYRFLAGQSNRQLCFASHLNVLLFQNHIDIRRGIKTLYIGSITLHVNV